MKALYTAFGAFAAVALLASCGSEDVLETVQTEVPAGKHLVTLTVDKDAQSRVLMDNTFGNMTWEEGDKIYVQYSYDDQLHEFDWNGYVEDGTDKSKATFVGEIDDNLFTNYTPVKVYYIANWSDGQSAFYLTDPEYESHLLQPNFVADSHGVFHFRNNDSYVYLSGSTDCGSDTKVAGFNANIGLQDFAMVKIPANIHGITQSGPVTVKVFGSNQRNWDYTINVSNPGKDLIFFVKTPDSEGEEKCLTGFRVKIGSGSSYFKYTSNTIYAGKRYVLSLLS